MSWVLAFLERPGQALLDCGAAARPEVGFELVHVAMLFEGSGGCGLVLLLGCCQLLPSPLLSLLPLSTGSFVGDPALLPPCPKPLFGAGHHLREAGSAAWA